MAKIKRLASLILAACVVMLFCPKPVLAAGEQGFNLSLNQQEYRAGDKIELSLSYNPVTEQDIGAFLVRVEFNSEAVRYKKTQNGTAIGEGYVKTTTEDHTLLSVYTIKNMNTPMKRGEVFRYVFTAESFVGKAEFHVSVEQLVNREGAEISGTIPLTAEAQMAEPTAQDCQMLSLSPSTGQLEPLFEPQVTQYHMEVPFEVKEMTFNAEVSSGATWKVNRKTLGAGGSTTEFQLVVTSQDASQSKTYTVMVQRKVKEAAQVAVTTSPRGKTTEIGDTTNKSAGSKNKAAKTNIDNVDTTEGAEEWHEDLEPANENAVSPAFNEFKQVGGGEHSGSSLVIQAGNYTPFLWGVCVTMLVGLFLYLIRLHMKLLILDKEEKLRRVSGFSQADEEEQVGAGSYTLKHSAMLDDDKKE